MDHLINFCLHNKLIVGILLVFICVWGVIVAPFDLKIPGLFRAPVPVDAIPDIGENQQIVFTEWKGRSPQDIEDQVSYPLTVAYSVFLVKTVRTYSFFDSRDDVIFKEDVEFYSVPGLSKSQIVYLLNIARRCAAELRTRCNSFRSSLLVHFRR